MIQICVYKNGQPHALLTASPDNLIANLQRYQALSSPLVSYAVRQVKPAVAHMGDAPAYDDAEVYTLTPAGITALLAEA